MKTRKIALLVLVCMLVASVLALAVACKPTTPPEPEDEWNGKIDLMKASDWEGNESETTYTAYNDSNNKLVIEYEKSGAWQFIKRTFIDDLDQLGQIKTLVMKVSMTTDSGDPYMTLKLEGETAKEVHIYDLSATEATLEWDLSAYDLTKASRLLIFAEGNNESPIGKITFSELYLTKAAINADHNVEKKPDDGEDTAWTWNEITATNTTVNAGWYDAGDAVYTVAKDGNAHKVTVNKVRAGQEYSALTAIISGEAIRTMKSFKITVKGTSGQAILVKPFDNAETKIEFDGTEQTVIINVEAFASDANRDYTQKDLTALSSLGQLGQDNRVNILALPGQAPATGEFTIISAEFSTQEAPAPEVKEEVTEITATNGKVTSAWYSNNAGFYTFNKEGSAVKVSYTTGAWQYFYANVKGEAIATMKKLVVEIKGAEGTRLLIKPFDAKDAWVTLTDAEVDTIEIDITDVLNKDFTASQKILIFVEPEKDASSVTGEMTLVNVEFSTEEVSNPIPPVVEEVTEITIDNGKVTSAWYSNNEGFYTFEKEGNSVKVSYETGAWQYFYANVKGEAITSMKKLVVRISGAEGTRLLIKPFDAKDAWVTLTDAEVDTVEIDITDVLNKDFTVNQKILIFVEPEKDASSVSGEMTLVSVEFSTEAVSQQPSGPQAIEYNGDQKLVINDHWYDKDGGKWTVAEAEGIWTLSYGANHSWGPVATHLKLGDAVMNYVVAEFKAPAGIPYILKFGDTNAFEVTGTGEWQVTSIALTKNVTGNVEVLIFAGWDDTNENSIEFKAPTLYNVSAVAEEGQALNINKEGALANAVKGSTRNNISFAENKTTISYSSPSWDSMIMWIDLGEGGFDKLNMEFKGLAGHTAILSLNGTEAKYEGMPGDSGTLTGEAQTLSVDVSGLKGIIFIRIFLDMNPNDVNAEGGTFEITQAVFTRTGD